MNSIDVVCPSCNNSLKYKDDGYNCLSCDTTYEIREGIPIFTPSDEYWCNVDRNTMLELIRDSEDSGDWYTASKKHIPDYMRAYEYFYRADAQFLFPVSCRSRILDAGSMWGGLTLPIAQYCESVVAVDKTWETLRFLKTRAKQMGIENISEIVSPIHKLPFPDNYFDFVMLNGVLEWLGMEQDVVLDEHWDKKRKDTHIHETNPRDMQLAALKELHRVVKPEGSIYIAIENRIGIQYFFGHPDDHMNVRFTTFMPRWYANIMTKYFRNTEYRTYVYTPNQLDRLVRQAGFNNVDLYSVYPHYGKISRLTPFSIFEQTKRLATEGYAHISVFLMSIIWRLFPSTACRHISPSIALLASANESAGNDSRLLLMLVNAGLIEKKLLSQYKLMMVNYRFGNDNSVNYLVFDNNIKKPIYFCKLSRRKNNEALKIESEYLEEVHHALGCHEIANTIPNLIFSGDVDDVYMQVTEYIDLDRIGFGLLAGLRRVNEFIPKSLLKFTFLWKPLKIFGRKLWLHQVEDTILGSIEWLATFQKQTKVGQFNFSTEVSRWIREKKQLIHANNIPTDGMDAKLSQLELMLGKFDEELPMCLQHGDFDICNLLRERKSRRLHVVDFEHMRSNQLPFFDLANLLFSSLVAEWKTDRQVCSLQDYAIKTDWNAHIKRWLDHYSKSSGISRELLSYLPGIAAIEQNAMQYPISRDPYDYPMYGEIPLKQMLDWRI